MNLYLLNRLDRCLYDQCRGFVVAARDEVEARAYAAAPPNTERPETWTSSSTSSCVEIGRALPEIEPGVLLLSFRAG